MRPAHLLYILLILFALTLFAPGPPDIDVRTRPDGTWYVLKDQLIVYDSALDDRQ